MTFPQLPSFLQKNKKKPIEQSTNAEVQSESQNSEFATDQQQIEQHDSSNDVEHKVNDLEAVDVADIRQLDAITQFIKPLEDIKKLSRESYKNTSAVQENTTAVKELDSNLQQSRGEIEQLRKYLDEMLTNQRQQNGELRREIHEWEQTTVEFFKLLERALDTEKDENKRFVQKIINEFDRLVKVKGLDRIIPQPDEFVVDKLHEAVDAEESSNILEGKILRCVQWGYRIGFNVIEKAKVVVAKQPNVLPEIIEETHSTEDG